MADFDDDEVDELDELDELDDELDPDLEEALGEDFEGLEDDDLDDYDLDDLDLGTDAGQDTEAEPELPDDDEDDPEDAAIAEDGEAVDPGAGDATALLEDDDLLDDVADVPILLDRELEVDDEVREGEFVCRSCFMAKRESALADEDRMLCRDCV